MAPTLPEFVARWRASALTERSAAQSHFIELCRVLGRPWPAQADPMGTFYTFEKGVATTGGGKGFADVWLRDHFAWEYKGKHKDLAAAYQQLLRYREDLGNPPLLVVCDLDRFEIHTNFTNTAKRVYRFGLADLLETAPLSATHGRTPLEVLRALWDDPDSLKPEQTPDAVTAAAARQFALLSESLRRAGHDPEESARFLIRLLFCLFAEDVGLLPEGLFTRLVANLRTRPELFGASVRQLFAAMATGGIFGADVVAHFNGGLFADDAALPLGRSDLDVLAGASGLDWRSIEPAIFGTLFERSLDPGKRAQLGAHYTSREDILLIVEPVLMAPLRRRWAEVRAESEALLARREDPELRRLAGQRDRGAVRRRENLQAELTRLLRGFQEEIAGVRVLDPACGSGNFLYVALRSLLDLEKEVIVYSSNHGAGGLLPGVGPGQLYGIELDPYAHELAQASVSIGYIQWLRDNGFGQPPEPILQALGNIRRMDAVLGSDAEGRPCEPEWPEADVIIGNPPFLGGQRLRRELGDEYLRALWKVYEGRLPGGADLVTYWFERSRALIADGKVKRAGLLATNSIRGGSNRRALERIKRTGDIFMAWSDRPWVLEGAAVRVSMVGFDSGAERDRALDGAPVVAINADLTGQLDLTAAVPLVENRGIAFQGVVKVGPFELSPAVSQPMLRQPNPNGLPNARVITPWMNGSDITGRPRGMRIVDFGEMGLEEAALFEAPFEYVREHVKPMRDTNNDRQRRTLWWRLGRSGSEWKEARRGKRRVIVTPRVAKYRLFIWADAALLPDSAIVAIAREDDYFFGVLHSKSHELWALRMGTFLGVGNDPRYTPTTTFETFPFPWPPGKEPAGDPRVEAIAAAARELVERRDRWLNPEGVTEAELKVRTLTNLYNARPAWLALAHEALDRAVLDAYGWEHDLSAEQVLERLLALNLERAGGDG